MKEQHISEPRINDRIRVREVRLVAADGEQLGIKTSQEALSIARAAGLDLVEVAANASPPVCRIMDWGKHKYEQDQRAKEAKRKQSQVVVKEMKFRPKIDVHDYETKKGHVVRFLKAGDKVKITIMFRGREQSRPELGFNLLKKLADDVAEDGFVESAPKQDGRNMIMVLGPTKKKAEARAEQRRRRETPGSPSGTGEHGETDPAPEPVAAAFEPLDGDPGLDLVVALDAALVVVRGRVLARATDQLVAQDVARVVREPVVVLAALVTTAVLRRHPVHVHSLVAG